MGSQHTDKETGSIEQEPSQNIHSGFDGTGYGSMLADPGGRPVQILAVDHGRDPLLGDCTD